MKIVLSGSQIAIDRLVKMNSLFMKRNSIKVLKSIGKNDKKLGELESEIEGLKLNLETSTEELRMAVKVNADLNDQLLELSEADSDEVVVDITDEIK